MNPCWTSTITSALVTGRRHPWPVGESDTAVWRRIGAMPASGDRGGMPRCPPPGRALLPRLLVSGIIRAHLVIAWQCRRSTAHGRHPDIVVPDASRDGLRGEFGFMTDVGPGIIRRVLLVGPLRCRVG